MSEKINAIHETKTKIIAIKTILGPMTFKTLTVYTLP